MHIQNLRYNAALRAFEATVVTANRRIPTCVWGDITLPPAQIASALTAKATRQLQGH